MKKLILSAITVSLCALVPLSTCAQTRSGKTHHEQLAFYSADRKAIKCKQAIDKYKYKKAYKKCLSAAKGGNLLAMTDLGLLLKNHISRFDVDGESAEYWLEKAAMQGFPEAQYQLASIYTYSKVTYKQQLRKAKGITWYIKAAEAGHRTAQMALGEIYENGDVVKRDFKKAVYWYEKSAPNNTPYAKERLRFIYGNNLANKSDANATSAKIITSAEVDGYLNKIEKNTNWIEPGNAESDVSYKEGKELLDSWDFDVSGGERYTHPKIIRALELLSQSSDQGNAKASYLMAIAYLYKNTQNSSANIWPDASVWLKRSADFGYLKAQKKLAKEFSSGANIVQSFPQAAYWNMKASEQGDKDATSYLEFLLLSGSVNYDEIPKKSVAAQLRMSAKELFFAGLEAGYKKNFSKAETLLLQSAKEGNVGAQAALGKMYYNGEGVPRSIEKAFKWYGKAGGNGDEQSQYMMGYLWDSNATQNIAYKMLLAGLNVDRVLKARYWYSKAVANGHEGAKIKLDALSSYKPIPPPPIKRGWLEQFTLDIFNNAKKNTNTNYINANRTRVEKYIYHPPRCYNIGNGMEQCFQ